MNEKNDLEDLYNAHYHFLPTQFLVKGFIGGEGAPDCNYEEYLAEFLNESKYFRNRTKGDPITLNKDQSHGEPDVDCNGFSLDFKLIGGESAIKAKRHTSHSITQLTNGGVGYGIPDGRSKEYEAVRIHLALRQYSCGDLEVLRQQYNKKDIISKDIIRILKELEVKKNILLFLPYAITVENTGDINTVVIVTKILEDCFLSSLEYRNKKIPGFETFFCCIHNRKMLFYSYENNRLKLVDSVQTYKSKTFRDLARYNSFTESNSTNLIIEEEKIY